MWKYHDYINDIIKKKKNLIRKRIVAVCKHLKIGNVGVYLYKYIYIIMFILLSGLRNVGRAILGRAIHVDLSGNQFFSRCFDSGSDDTSQNLGNLESRDS